MVTLFTHNQPLITDTTGNLALLLLLVDINSQPSRYELVSFVDYK